MKKTLLFLLLALASGPAAFAQARPGGSLSSKDYTGGATTESGNSGFGVKGGYNFSRPYGDDITNVSAYHAFHAGVYGQLGFNNFSSVQVEVLYNRKGYNSDASIANGGAANKNQETRLDYLEVPVLYVANVTSNVSFHIGPQISLLTKVLQGGGDKALAPNGFNTVDYGGVAGAELRVGPARLGARYDLSFGRIFDTSKQYSNPSGAPGTVTLSSVHNQVVQLYVGIGLRQ